MPTQFATRKPIGNDELPNALIITRNLPPLVGGMERLVWHIVDELREAYRLHVIGPAGCGAHLPHGYLSPKCRLNQYLCIFSRQTCGLVEGSSPAPAYCICRKRAYRSPRLDSCPAQRCKLLYLSAWPRY